MSRQFSRSRHNQNAQKVKTDFVSDEKVADELGPDYEPPYSQLTHAANICNAKERILKHRKKKSIKGLIKYILKNVDKTIMYYII